jgi:hypothetical protein
VRKAQGNAHGGGGMSELPTFSVRERTITHENPKIVSDGLMVCPEAFIEVDTTTMSQTFVHLLMHHMGEGHIRVKVARVKEQSNG